MISKAAIPDFHAVLVRDLREPHFEPHWHFHPEYQLFLVLEGTGSRFVGDQVQHFGPGDLVLTGPNLPHVWRSDEAYFNRESGLRTRGIVVYFREAVFGEKLLLAQEGLRMRQLLERSQRGLAFYGATQERAAAAMEELLVRRDFDQILGLLQILHALSLSEEYALLSRLELASPLRPSDQARMEKVYAHLMGRFTEPVRLADVAAVASMTPTAFCRYFRERTNKPLSQFVAELRVGYACKLMAEADLSISQVALECGYRTLSNFNRQFKAVSGLTPRAYKASYAAARGRG